MQNIFEHIFRNAYLPQNCKDTHDIDYYEIKQRCYLKGVCVWGGSVWGGKTWKSV